MSRKVRIFALLLVVVLLLPMVACAKSRGREELIVVQMDDAGTAGFEDQYYFQARWIQAQCTLEPGQHTVVIHVVLDDNHTPDKADRIVYKKTKKKVEGTYVSPEIFLKFRDSRIEAYRIDIIVDDVLYKSGNIHRMLLNLNNNTVCMRGMRFRDVEKSKTDKWFTFRPINFSKTDDGKVIDLVGSNMYLVGQLILHRDGDSFMFEIVSYDDMDKSGLDTTEYEADPHELEHKITDHKIEFNDVRVAMYSNWDAVDEVSHGALSRHFKLGEWYNFRKLGILGKVIFYLNGKISYNPNGLPRINATQSKGALSNLLNTFAF